MYIEVFATFLLTTAKLLTGEGLCKAPNGEMGECISITDCPPLFEAFSNPKKADEAYLIQFLCPNPTPDDHRVTVCCGTQLNLTLDTKEDLTRETELSNRRYCGLQRRDDYFSIDTRIAIDEFPWLANYIVGTSSRSEKSIRCGGTLINNRYVLTTARCVIYERSSNDKPEMIRLGDYHLRNQTDCVPYGLYNDTDCSTYELYEIEEKIPHPFYDLSTQMNDIALIRLKKIVIYSDFIRPICLPTLGTTFAKWNDVMYATGLGDFVGTLDKKKIKTRLMPNEDCDRQLEIFARAESISKPPLTANKLCTLDTHDSDSKACSSNAGGPTMFSHRNQWHIEGILINPWCNQVGPVVNTRVSTYLKWIRENIRP